MTQTCEECEARIRTAHRRHETPARCHHCTVSHNQSGL